MSRIVFEKILNAYKKRDDEYLLSGDLPMRSTEKGFWGSSNLNDIYEFFKIENYDKNTKFIDLGCGDGRVVLVANLFVKAEGVEWDSELVFAGKKIAEDLELEYPVFKGDIKDVDFSRYDLLFMYADKSFDFIKEKLLNELKGQLILYHDTYHPYFLKKEKIRWIGQIPFFKYTNPNN